MISYFSGVDSEAITWAEIGAAFTLLLLTIMTGFAHDAEQKSERRLPALA